MARIDTPWAGLLALGLMFALPFLPDWLFEGPRTIRHRPRRHICADCGAPWTDDHRCPPDDPALPQPLRGRIQRRPTATTTLVVRPGAGSRNRQLPRRPPNRR